VRDGEVVLHFTAPHSGYRWSDGGRYSVPQNSEHVVLPDAGGDSLSLARRLPRRLPRQPITARVPSLLQYHIALADAAMKRLELGAPLLTG
jgi:hypothetical protein